MTELALALGVANLVFLAALQQWVARLMAAQNQVNKAQAEFLGSLDRTAHAYGRLLKMQEQRIDELASP